MTGRDDAAVCRRCDAASVTADRGTTAPPSTAAGHLPPGTSARRPPQQPPTRRPSNSKSRPAGSQRPATGMRKAEFRDRRGRQIGRGDRDRFPGQRRPDDGRPGRQRESLAGRSRSAGALAGRGQESRCEPFKIDGVEAMFVAAMPDAKPTRPIASRPRHARRDGPPRRHDLVLQAHRATAIWSPPSARISSLS